MNASPDRTDDVDALLVVNASLIRRALRFAITEKYDPGLATELADALAVSATNNGKQAS